MGLFSKTKKHDKQQQQHGTVTPQFIPQQMNNTIQWDGTKFKIQLKMAKSRIDIQRSKKDNEIEQIRRKIAQHLVDKKEPLARILGDRVLREKTMLISFDIIETCIEVLISSNNNLSMNNNLQNTPNDLKESISSIVFSSSRVNIPELINVCDILKNHFGYQIINDINNCQGPYKSFINEILIIQLNGNPPDGYLILQELSHIAKQHNINWTPPPEETDLNNFSNNNNNHHGGGPGGPGGPGDLNIENNHYDPSNIPGGFPSNIPGYPTTNFSNNNPTPSAPPDFLFPTHKPSTPSNAPNNDNDDDADLQARFNNILDK